MRAFCGRDLFDVCYIILRGFRSYYRLPCPCGADFKATGDEAGRAAVVSAFFCVAGDRWDVGWRSFRYAIECKDPAEIVHRILPMLHRTAPEFVSRSLCASNRCSL